MSGEPRPALYLVRHADAGDRERFSGEDLTRPLSDLGEGQARRIAERLATKSLARIVTSPARRCIETLEPLAEATSLELEPLDELVEGADPLLALECLLELAPRPDAKVVACSHGDVIGSIIEHLLARQVSHRGRPRLPKGATVNVALDEGGAPVHLRFVGEP